MSSIRTVIEYTGLNYQEALELPCDTFMLCKKNWYVEQLNKTPEGREYLEEVRISRQTTPDWVGIRKLMNMLNS